MIKLKIMVVSSRGGGAREIYSFSANPGKHSPMREGGRECGSERGMVVVCNTDV